MLRFLNERIAALSNRGFLFFDCLLYKLHRFQSWIGDSALKTVRSSLTKVTPETMVFFQIFRTILPILQ
ncbi:hypothetical protein BWI97_19995 [Siphonobacter sp. BAB-5405]|nr:hypothetical protein BWI97_19995 [Siphonobacter sp. BAB-5405]